MSPRVYYSVVIPGHNESKSIVRLINGVRTELIKLHKPFEIIFVNDNSTDNSSAILDELKKEYKELVVIRRTSNPGVGNAKREGFAKVRGKVIITMDGDLSHNPAQIPELIHALNGYDIVCGSRYSNKTLEKHNMPFSRKVISLLFNLIFGLVIALPVKDFTSGFRVIKREVIDGIDLQSSGFGIYIEIPIKAHLKNFKMTEVSIVYEKAESGSNLSYLKQGKEYFKVALYGLLHSKFLKFLLVGVSGTVVNTITLFSLTEFFGVYYLISSVVAIELSILSNFFLNNYFTFSERKEGNLVKKLLKYNGFLSISGFFVFILLYVFTEFFGIYYLLSNILAIIIVFLINYLFSQKFVWKYAFTFNKRSNN